MSKKNYSLKKAQAAMVTVVVVIILVVVALLIYSAYRTTNVPGTGQLNVSAPGTVQTNQQFRVVGEIPANITNQVENVTLYYSNTTINIQNLNEYNMLSVCNINSCNNVVQNGNFSVPLSINQPGTYYYRLVAVINGTVEVSNERTIIIVGTNQTTGNQTTGMNKTYNISFTTAPSSAVEDMHLNVSWRINGTSTSIRHTAVHYDTRSVSNPTLQEDYAFASPYLCTNVACQIPANFTVSFSINNSGTYYYRAHAVINGTHYWTDEKMLVVAPTNAIVNQATGDEYIVSIAGFAYNPANPSISPGDVVTWTNDDTVPHTVSSLTGTELASAVLQPGETYSHAFADEGIYSYYCTIHPNMRASAIVANT